MACDNCLENCDPIVTDRCTKYTGVDIPELGICKGMVLYELEDIIFDKIISLGHASSVKLDTISTTCSFITTLLMTKTQPFTVQEFAEIVFAGFCSLDSKITSLVPSPFSFNTSCLAGDLTTKDKIIQAIITKLCADSTRISTLETNSATKAELAAITSAVSTQFNTRMVPYVYYPYAGPINNFDNTGKGLSAAFMDKVYLANGSNNTQDWRGRSPIGAIQGVPGATLDSNVNPMLSANLSYNHVMGGKKGSSSEILDLSKIPSHVHTLVDPGHSHTFEATNNTNGGPRPDGFATNHSGGVSSYSTETKSTGITLASSGGNQAHNNLHPVIGCLYIVYIP